MLCGVTRRMTVNDAKRDAALREMLLERRRVLSADVHGRVRDKRTGDMEQGRDNLEVSDADIQGDLALSLLVMRSEALSRLDEAVQRLETGGYGTCVACDSPIAEARLRVLPFAIRCTTCEATREGEGARSPLRDNVPVLFPDAF
jgi:DnaK suppressor protein